MIIGSTVTQRNKILLGFKYSNNFLTLNENDTKFW